MPPAARFGEEGGAANRRVDIFLRHGAFEAPQRPTEYAGENGMEPVRRHASHLDSR